MHRRIKRIESDLMLLYGELKRLFSGLHCLTLSVSQRGREKPHNDGFIHIGKDCRLLNNLRELHIMVREKTDKNLILYQKFDRVLK